MSEHPGRESLDLSALSPREADVLSVAVEGLSVRDVATRLSLSEATVRSHFSATYSKLGVSGRVELLARLQAAPPAPREPVAPVAQSETPPLPDRALAARPSLRTHSLWAYTLWFGSLWGLATFGYAQGNQADGSTDTGMIWVWAAMALAGSILVVLKNRRVRDRGLQTRLWLGDLAVMGLALVLVAAIPASVGMLKGAVLLLLFGGYGYGLFKTLETRRLA